MTDELIVDEELAVDRSVDSLWLAHRYSKAAKVLRSFIKKCYDKQDWDLWAYSVVRLHQTLSLRKKNKDSERVLSEAIAVRPMIRLRAAMARHLWEFRRRPDKAIEFLLSYPSQVAAIDDEFDGVKQANLLARLYLAAGDGEAAVQQIVDVLARLPKYIPPLGYLFDFDMLSEMYEAGIRHPALADYINRIEEPRFLIQMPTPAAFLKVKEGLNSPPPAGGMVAAFG